MRGLIIILYPYLGGSTSRGSLYLYCQYFSKQWDIPCGDDTFSHNYTSHPEHSLVYTNWCTNHGYHFIVLNYL